MVRAGQRRLGQEQNHRAAALLLASWEGRLLYLSIAWRRWACWRRSGAGKVASGGSGRTAGPAPRAPSLLRSSGGGGSTRGRGGELSCASASRPPLPAPAPAAPAAGYESCLRLPLLGSRITAIVLPLSVGPMAAQQQPASTAKRAGSACEHCTAPSLPCSGAAAAAADAATCRPLPAAAVSSSWLQGCLMHTAHRCC
jgi:hypothetical protein